MKKLFGKKIAGLFICICLVLCMMPMAAFAQNTETSSQKTERTDAPAKTTDTTKQEEKEIEKIKLSLGSNYKKVYDGKEISKSDVYSLVSTKSGGASVFTYKWYDENGTRMNTAPVNAGVYKLYIKVSKEDPSYTGEATVTYTIEQRPLEWDVSDLKITKPYDGTTKAAKIQGYLKIKGIVEGDDAALAYDSIIAADFPTADVQTIPVPITVENAEITGVTRSNYSLPKTPPTAQASIVKAYIKEFKIPGDDNEYRLIVQETVNITEDLAKGEFSSEEAVKAALRKKIAEVFDKAEAFSISYYTPVLQILKNDEWVDVDTDTLSNDITVTLEYPESSNGKDVEYVIFKMKTKGENAGEIEVWAHTEIADGLEILLSQGDTLAVGFTADKAISTTMIIIICAAVLMVISGFVFFKLNKADKEDAEEEQQ